MFDGKFDSVCAFYVLEHIANPVCFLNQASSFLKENGKIIISVPNFNVYMKKYSKGYSDFQYLRGHLSYFTPELLTKTLRLAGFNDIQILGNQLYSVENAIHWAQTDKPFKSYCQFELPDGLEFVNNFFKEQMEKKSYIRYVGRSGDISTVIK